MGNSESQYRSISKSSTNLRRSTSRRSPFDHCKHGQALQRLETHGSLKTVPSSQQEGGVLTESGVLNRPYIFRSGTRQETFEEEYAAALGDSHPQQPKSPTSADLFVKSDQQSGVDLLTPLIQYLPNTVYQPDVLHRGDLSQVANLPNAPRLEGGQSPREASSFSVYPLPNVEADGPSQVTQQALDPGQILPKPHQVLSLKSSCWENTASITPQDLQSQIPSSEGMIENDIMGVMARNFSAGTQNSDQNGRLSACYVEEVKGQGKGQQSVIEKTVPEQARQAHSIAQSPILEEIDEYLWSPAPSDDGQEAPSTLRMPGPRQASLDALRAFPTSGLASDSYGNEHIRSRSGLLGSPDFIDSLLPHIDVFIPEGDINLDSHSDFLSSSRHASTMGSRESRRILFHYSGTITHGASSRPISEVELEEGMLHSLGSRGKIEVRMPSWMNSSSQADCNIDSEQIRGEHESNDQSEMSPLDRIQILSADAGPGSSQTSSSLSTDRNDGDPSGLEARSGMHTLPTWRARCHTPPLLFGRPAISGPERSNTTSRLTLGSTIGRFNQNMRATRLKETSRLPTALHSLGEQDWETVSGETEAHTHAIDSIAFDTKTGSSLADNSDSGNLSLSGETPYPFRSINARPVREHPAHPRHNYSFMLLKNSQTGDLVQVPQYEYASGGCLPNNNASSRLVSSIRADSTYQHPSPLQVEHTHPFTSSLPIIQFTRPSAISGENDRVIMQQNHPNSDSSCLGLSEGVEEAKAKQTQNQSYKISQDVLRAPNPVAKQNQDIMDSRVQSHQSSAWLSTVSGVTSSEASLPGNRGPLAKMIVCEGKGRANETPEQRGNREVGSSLADASSPGANFSSSPAPLGSSLDQLSDTTPSLGQRLHKQAVERDLEFGSQHMLADFHKSFVRSIEREDSAISTSTTEYPSRSHSASGLRPQQREPSPCRRRSSSESHSRLMESPSTQKASAPSLLSSAGDAQQIASSGLLLRNPFLLSDENGSQYKSNQQNPIERRGRQPKADDASIDDPTMPSSTNSRNFIRDGVLHTDAAPPILCHPVYGHERPWDRITPGPLRPRPHPNPLRPLFQRPVARAESPHLHRIAHPPTPELLERHVLLSRVYLIPCMVVPPIALVYGHGYMDGLVRLQTAGEINGFRNAEKTIALFWGYGLSAICILAVVVAMTIISASA